jgi:hypothetical protein
MSLGTDELNAIDELLGVELVSQSGGDAHAFASFRRRFPRLSVTQCDASDVDLETPFRVYPRTSLLLVDASDQCARFTSDPARATGIVVARHKERQ